MNIEEINELITEAEEYIETHGITIATEIMDRLIKAVEAGR